MNILAPLFPPLVDAAVKATILLGLTWIAGALLKNRPASFRHTVRAFALCGLLLLPVLSLLMPAWHWKGLPWLPLNEQLAASSPEAAHSASAFHKSVTGSAESASLSAGASATLQPANYKSGAPVIARSRIAPNWPRLLTLVWLLGAGLGALRLVVSRSRFANLINKAAPVDDLSWNLQVKEIAFLLGIRRPVALLESKDTEVPLTAGAFRPKVILSPDYREWSPLRRDAILHHELTHVRRWDILTHALCQVAVAIYWFHPLIWLNVRAMREEREQACDDQVLAAGARPSEYAHELLEFASALRQPEFIAALAMARRSQLEGRVMALLNPMQQRGSISRKTTLAIGALTLCAVLPLAAIQTAAPRDNGNEQRKPATPAQPQNAPSPAAKTNVPPEPQSPEVVLSPPADGVVASPESAAPPVEGILGGVRDGIKAGIQDGIKGEVQGGVPGGVRDDVRNVPSMPTAPRSAPIPPRATSPAIAPLPPIPAAPRRPSTLAIPKPPRVAPAAPQYIPHPVPAPIAPRVPSTPPAG